MRYFKMYNVQYMFDIYDAIFSQLHRILNTRRYCFEIKTRCRRHILNLVCRLIDRLLIDYILRMRKQMEEYI